MASYQTARFVEYAAGFQEVARNIAERVRVRAGDRLKEYDGSFSIIGRTSKETAAKIVIYQPNLGRENLLPFPVQQPGVYILVRSNGEIGPRIWNSQISRNLLERCVPGADIGIAPKHAERFRFFPVMAGESIAAIEDLLVEIAERL
jgi:hypothetical protein